MTRFASLSGVVFAALWIAAFVVGLGDEENPSDAEIVAYYADEGDRGAETTLMFLVLAASLVFLLFVTVLRERLTGASGPLGSVVLGAGLIATTLWIIAAVFWGGVAYTANETHPFRVDPDTERLVGEMAYLFFVAGTVAALPLVVATSLAARRSGVLPRWLVVLGLVVAFTMLGALAVLPFFLFLAWVVLVAVTLAIRGGQPVAGRTPVGEAT